VESSAYYVVYVKFRNPSESLWGIVELGSSIRVFVF
jgi:hypothetical protein